MGTSILGKSWDAGVVFFFSPHFPFFFSPVGGACEFMSALEREGEREVWEKCRFNK